MHSNLDENNISNLIYKKILNKLTPQEESVLESWLQTEENRVLYDRITNPENVLSKAKTYDRFRKQFESRQRRPLRRAIRVAAVLLIPIAISCWVLFDRFITDSEINIPYSSICNNEALPSLILDNGEKMQITSRNKEEITKAGIIIKDTSDIIVCELVPLSKKSEEPKMIEIVTPAAKRMTITLIDGTKVMLNSNSKIRFPGNFSKNSREVYAEGELFFEVARDNEKPFIVNINETKVTVLGTSFNVRAYPGENSVKTTLCTGKVQFSAENISLTLAPGEQSVYQNTEKTIEKHSVDVYDYTAWKDGVTYFNNKSLSEIMYNLSMWYGFEYVFDNPDAGNESFTVEVSRDISLDKIVELINNTNTVKIFIKKDMKVHIK